MKTETLNTQPDLQAEALASPEFSAEEIALSFENAHKTILKLTTSPNFDASCAKSGIDPYEDMGTEKYWDHVAGTVNDMTTRASKRREDQPPLTPQQKLNLKTLDLLASTPQFLYKSFSLKQTEGRKDRQQKEVASVFNGKIRDFAMDYPATPVSIVKRGMLRMVDSSIEGKPLRQASQELLTQTVRGVQHEMALGQVLSYTGREFRAAEMHEDLSGADWFVQGRRGILRVDSKASSFNMNGKPYATRADGTIVLTSVAHDREFHDQFFIPGELAESRSEGLNALLDHAEAHPIAA